MLDAVPPPCGGSRDRRLMAETTRGFRGRLGSREPEIAPLGYVTNVGAATLTGAYSNSRSLGRASALLFRCEAPSIASCGLLHFVRRPVAGAERSPHAPAPRGSDTGPRLDLPLSVFAGRLPEWSDPRPRQPPEDWTPAMRLRILPSIASSGAGPAIFSPQPARCDRRRASYRRHASGKPPSRPARFDG